MKTIAEIDAEIEEVKAIYARLKDLKRLHEDVHLLELVSNPSKEQIELLEIVNGDGGNVTWTQLVSQCRTSDVVQVRSLYCYFRGLAGYNLSEIGREINRLPSSVRHAVGTILDRLSLEPKFKEMAQRMGEKAKKNL